MSDLRHVVQRIELDSLRRKIAEWRAKSAEQYQAADECDAVRVDTVEATDATLTLAQRVERLLRYRPTLHTSPWTREAEAVLMQISSSTVDVPAVSEEHVAAMLALLKEFQAGRSSSRASWPQYEKLDTLLRELDGPRASGPSSSADVPAPCVCHCPDSLVQEWVSKARAVARGKGFDYPKSDVPAPESRYATNEEANAAGDKVMQQRRQLLERLADVPALVGETEFAYSRRDMSITLVEAVHKWQHAQSHLRDVQAALVALEQDMRLNNLTLSSGTISRWADTLAALHGPSENHTTRRKDE